MKSSEILKAIGKKSTVDWVVDAMMEEILAHRWVLGEKIPTENELVEQYGVGRNSIREAVKALVTMGLLEIKRADGTYVTNCFTEKMLNPLIYSLALEEDMERSLAELRILFGLDSLKMAAQHATSEDCDNVWAAFENLAGLFRNPDADYESLLDADIAFHDAVNTATHNILFQRFYPVLIRLSRESRIRELKYITEHGERESLIETHRVEARVILEHTTENIFERVHDSYKYVAINVKDKSGTAYLIDV